MQRASEFLVQVASGQHEHLMRECALSLASSVTVRKVIFRRSTFFSTLSALVCPSRDNNRWIVIEGKGYFHLVEFNNSNRAFLITILLRKWNL